MCVSSEEAKRLKWFLSNFIESMKEKKKAPIVSVTLHFRIDQEDDDYKDLQLDQLKLLMAEKLYLCEEIQTLKLNGSFWDGFKTKCRLLRPEQVAEHINKKS